MLGAYYSSAFTDDLRIAIVVFLCLLFLAGSVALVEMWRDRNEPKVYDWQRDGECTNESHVRLVKDETLTDAVMAAVAEAEERSLTVAQCLYQYDLREFWPGCTPFDELPLRSKLRYFDQAETVLWALTDIENAKSPAPRAEAKGAGLT